MPAPVINQPIRTAAAPAPDAMFCGNENTPLPIIEPITSAVSRPSRKGCAVEAVVRAAAPDAGDRANVKETLAELTHSYRQVRQDEITADIVELAAGAGASV
jgi:hypothetical protein